MPLKWKPQHFLEFTFPLSLVSILGTKKFHRNTSTSTIILKIQIKNIFFSFLFSLTFLATKQCNKYKEMSFQAQNFLGISKALGTQSVISCLAPLPLLHNKTQQQQPFPFPQNLFTYTRHRFNCLSLSFSPKWVHNLYRLSHWTTMVIVLTQRTRAFRSCFQSLEPHIRVKTLTKSKSFW